MAGIDQTEALNQVAASLGKAYTATTAPIRGRLTSTIPTAGAPGTELVNSGGSTYASADVSAALPAPASMAALPITNTAAITWSNLPAVGSPGVQGIELWDSAGSPQRKWFGALSQAKVVALGDSLTISPGGLSVTTA